MHREITLSLHLWNNRLLEEVFYVDRGLLRSSFEEHVT